MMQDLELDGEARISTDADVREGDRNATSATDQHTVTGPRAAAMPLEGVQQVAIAESPESMATTTSTDGLGAEDVAARLEKVEASIASGFQQVLKSFELKLAFDQFKEQQVSRLHDELQEHKAGLIAKTARPLVNGIIRLHDDLGRIVEALRKRDAAELTPDRFFKVIQGFQQDLEIVLSDNGVDTYTEDGDRFDPQRQKALTTTPSGDPAIAGRIAARLRPGFEQGGDILQKERVAVYVLANAAAQSSDLDPAASTIQTIEGEDK